MIPIYDKQAQFLSSKSLFTGFVGGRGSGKSEIGAWRTLCRTQALPGKTHGIFAPSYKMLNRSTLKSFYSVARPYILGGNKQEGIIYMKNGANVLCCSLDDPESGRGTNLSTAWFDEASLIVKDAYDIVIACLREGGVQGELYATFTPKGRGHWTFDTFGSNEHAKLIIARTSENPFLPANFAEVLRSQYTSRFAAQELDAEFLDMEGALCSAEWFPTVEVAPANLECARGWDLAATAKKTADYTAGVKMGRDADGRFYVTGLVHGQIAAGSILSTLRNTAGQDGTKCQIAIEQEGGASGKIAMDSLIKGLAGYRVKAMPATGDKATRVMPFLAQAEAGNVSLVKGDWNKKFLDEFTGFPETDHDDIVDGTAHAFNRLAKPVMAMVIG